MSPRAGGHLEMTALAGAGVLPGLERAGLALSCRPHGAAKAGKEWGGALLTTLIHPGANASPGRAGGALLESPRSSGRKPPAPRAGPQRSQPVYRVHGPGRKPSLAAPAPAAALPVPAAATPNSSPFGLMSLRRGRSGHDAKGAGQIVNGGNLPGGRRLALSPAHAEGRLWCRLGWLADPRGGAVARP